MHLRVLFLALLSASQFASAATPFDGVYEGEGIATTADFWRCSLKRRVKFVVENGKLGGEIVSNTEDWWQFHGTVTGGGSVVGYVWVERNTLTGSIHGDEFSGSYIGRHDCTVVFKARRIRPPPDKQ